MLAKISLYCILNCSNNRIDILTHKAKNFKKLKKESTSFISRIPYKESQMLNCDAKNELKRSSLLEIFGVKESSDLIRQKNSGAKT